MGENVVFVSHFVPRSERIKRLEQTWTNVYVKNLDLNYSDDELKTLFSKFGEITSCVVQKKENIGSKFGFINYKNHSDAEEAVKQMNGFILGDKSIVCCRAQKKTERQSELRRNYEYKRRETIKQYQGRNLFVKNVEDHITEDKFRKVFEPYGNIVSIRLMTNEKGGSKGFGFVCYSTREEAEKALNGIGKNTILDNCSKPLYVAIHEPKETRQQRFSRSRSKFQQQPNMGYPPPGSGTVYYTPPPYGNQGPMVRNQPPFQQGYQNMPPGGGSGYPVMQMPPGGRGGPRGGPRGGQTGQPRGTGTQDLNKQKDILGEQLFQKINEREPSLAGKITGMIIHSPDFSFEAVSELIGDDSKLENIIKDAKVFIEQQMNQQEEGNENE